MSSVNGNSTQLLIAGGGAAGLAAALAGVESGLDVVLVDAADFTQSASVQAQGGFSAVTAQGRAAGDTVAAHVADTLAAGAGHGDPATVAAICGAAAAHVDTLAGWGTVWDRAVSLPGRHSDYALTREAAHSADRILHCGGDATGAGIVAALSARAHTLATGTALPGRLTLLPHSTVRTLLMDSGAVTGALIAVADGTQRTITANAVLLAAGGISGVFDTRTSRWANPAAAVGLAWDAGAVFADAEMVQFHPTYAPDAGFMISEALRGEGAVLRDATGARFMTGAGAHPAAELAPRDVVARGVARATSLTGGAWLDAAPIVAREGRGFLARRFPTITAALARAGLDLEREPVRVTPAEHYWMGGVAVDRHARSTVPGLLVAGEAARTGLHGANRLASNSLLEAVHTGIAASRTVAAGLCREPGRPALSGPKAVELPVEVPVELPAGVEAKIPQGEEVGYSHDVARVRELADAHLGVSRTGTGLETALGELRLLASTQAQAARIIAAAALARTESLGAHNRVDEEARPDAGSRQRPRRPILITMANEHPRAVGAQATELQVAS